MKSKLPFTPSDAFMQESIKMAKDKGWVGTDAQLANQILVAYRAKRKQLTAQKLGKQVHKRGHTL